MDNDDFQKLVEELQAVDVQLPIHKRALREHILEVQAQRMGAKPRSIVAIGARLVRLRGSMTSRKVLSIGAVIIVAGVLLAGLLIILPVHHQPPAKKLIAEATKKVAQMNPEKVAAISEEYEDLNDCLQDAKDSDNLRIAPAAEVDRVLEPEIQEEHAAEVYVTYTDANEHTVVIGLDTASEPLFAVDVGRTEVSIDAQKAAKQAEKTAKNEEKALSRTAKALEKDLRKGLLQPLLD